MPRPTMPPTPTSSTEMKGQDSTHQLSTLQMSFELPPSAIGASGSPRRPHSDPKVPNPAMFPENISSQQAFPRQASETVKSSRRSSAAQKGSLALPPPPTRSRKIIQMKPRPQEERVEPPIPVHASSTSAKSAGTSGAKKRQPSATSAAGRKIARKTAHSLIERRRRSKMNEEFAVLKSMVPACTGEMHKLAILEASIEYVRYLEICVSQLKTQRDSGSSVPTSTEFTLPPSSRGDAYDERDDELGDVEMTGSEAPSPTRTEADSRSHRPSEPPALPAQDARRRHDSYSSASTDLRHYSYSASSVYSPVLGPQTYSNVRGPSTASNSISTSPALAPQLELDQEATVALLMLTNDRRGTTDNGVARGMSVRDLLSA
ncbi:hypothetical protein BJ170DRAFT_435049 [Xylariales sp. AK1849]|nr:hypothetical protein BJ170DRAFT_435049 [Xylariales sp. AK1849]